MPSMIAKNKVSTILRPLCGKSFAYLGGTLGTTSDKGQVLVEACRNKETPPAGGLSWWGFGSDRESESESRASPRD